MVYYLEITLDDIMSRDLILLTEDQDFFYISEVDTTEFGDDTVWKIEKNTGKVRNFDIMGYYIYEADHDVKETTKEKFIEHFRLLGLMSA